MGKRILAFLVITVFAGVLPVSADFGHEGTDTRCLDCHVMLPFEGVPLLFHTDISAICSSCHQDFTCAPKTGKGFFTHPVSVVPSFKIPDDMPLDAEKRISCITCHVYHQGKIAREEHYPFLLRRPLNEKFCFTCHGKM